MKTKLSILTVVALFAAFAIPSAAFAWQGQRGAGMGTQGYGYHNGYHMGGQYGPGYNMPPNGQWSGYAAPMMQFTPEQQAACDKIMTDFQEKAYGLRTQISSKQMELHYLSQNPKTDPKAISSLVNEVTSLQNQLHDLRVKTATTLQSDLKIDSNNAYALLRGFGQGGYGNNMYGAHHPGGRHHRR